MAGSSLMNNSNASIFSPDDVVQEDLKFKRSDVASPRTWPEDKGPSVKLSQNVPKVGPVKNYHPKRISNCSMCGNPGHSESTCPFRMCLNCGRQSNVFVSMCRKCKANSYKICRECNQRGHIKNQCPDLWRRYHSTTSGEYVEPTETVNEKLVCCNCGKEGHLYEDCKDWYFSIYPPTSVFVKNKTEHEVYPILDAVRRVYDPKSHNVLHGKGGPPSAHPTRRDELLGS